MRLHNANTQTQTSSQHLCTSVGICVKCVCVHLTSAVSCVWGCLKLMISSARVFLALAMSASRAAWSSEWPLNSSENTHNVNMSGTEKTASVIVKFWVYLDRFPTHPKASKPTEDLTGFMRCCPTTTIYSFTWNDPAAYQYFTKITSKFYQRTNNIWCNSLSAGVGAETSDYPPQGLKITNKLFGFRSISGCIKKEFVPSLSTDWATAFMHL